MTNQKPKIFLSYAREDMGIAKQLYSDLKRYGLDVWLDTESLLPGDRWKDKIQDAIENSNYFIALLSTRSVNKKGFVQKELKTALEVLDLFSSSERFILPIRLDDCEVYEIKLKEHHWVDLFPESKYQNGLRKILQVVTPLTFIIRHKPTELSSADVTEILKLHGYYDSDKNPDGKGIEHQYELKEINGDKVIFDKAMDLMWQQSGSVNRMNFEDAKREIRKLNQKCFAGFDDWRLPTVEEAMSLMEANKKDLYINSIFDSKKDWIWTADLKKDESRAWVIDFSHGGCDKHYLSGSYDLYVRAVRSGKSS